MIQKSVQLLYEKIQKLTGLFEINMKDGLSGNRLTGIIPTELGLLTSLEVLDLSKSTCTSSINDSMMISLLLLVYALR